MFSQGFVWPDEIFQSIEPAYFMVTGRGNLAWEFTDQVRSVLYPYILSVWIRIVFLFSTDPTVLFHSTRVVLAGIYLASVLMLSRFFLKTESEKKEIGFGIIFLIFSFVFLLFPLNYYFGFRTLTESISTSLAILSIFWIQIRFEKQDYRFFLPSLILGLTYGLRFQMGLFLILYIPLFCYQLWQKKLIKEAGWFLFGLFTGFVIYLISDIVYYGIPFISSFNYFKFNIVKGVAKQWGTSPFPFYFQSYLRYFQFLLIFLIPGIYSNFKKLYPILLATASFILIHSMIGHKELRFIYLSYPILLYLIASGILVSYSWIQAKRKKWAPVFLMLILLLTGFQYRTVLLKKIQWNFCNENLQLFLQADKHGLKGNSLIGVSEVFAWGAGYVYMGNAFKDNLYFHDLQTRSTEETEKILKEEKIQNILIFDTTKDHYCKTYGYCKTIFPLSPYSWISR
ncbi:hypothetical protein [Leptospira idonii]